MKRSGGRAGRPFGHLGIAEIELHVRHCENDSTDLIAILAELGLRKSKRSQELRDLTLRLLGDNKPQFSKPAGPMFE